MATQTGSISFESTKGLQSYAKQNFSTLSQVLGQFATCETSASTAAKVATIMPSDPNWTLQNGTTVTVTFSNANSATTPTLNVNGTGAKQIRDSEGNVLTQAAREWAEGAAIALTYDGTYWRIQDSSLMERVHVAETEIDQTATSITSLATLEDTYTKPDGTTGTNSIKSQFTQTANAINAKVDKDGVIASINASVEEENGSQIKISADKVNIEGAAIFSSGRLSTTSLNNTYATSSTANTANATEETLYYASNSTTAPAIPTSAISTNSASTYNAWNLTLPTYSSSYPYLFTCLQRKSIGNTYSWTKVMQSSYAAWTSTINTTANNAAPKTSAVSRTQRIYYRTNTALSSSITGPTTWITKNDNGFNTSAPTTAVTGWSTKPTPLAASTASDAAKYLYLYTCTQTQTVSQAANNGTGCSASTVLLDDTETIIDGGKIITGSITAERINVTDLQAIGATIGGFDITTTAIKTKNVAVTSNVDNSIALSSVDFTRTINSTSREGLRFAIGDKFGVTGDGAIYASSVDLTGKITATSGTIGGCTISNGVLQVANANITGSISGSKINASEINIGSLAGEIGGRNLLQKSSTLTAGSDSNGNSNTTVDGGYGSAVKQIETTGAWSGPHLKIGQALTRAGAKVGDTVTLSIWLTTDSTTEVTTPALYLYRANANSSTIGINGLSTTNNTTVKLIKGKWVRLWCTFDVTEYSLTATTARFEFSQATSYKQIWSAPQLEKGNKPTDWTPALEDIDNAIDDAATTATNYIYASGSGIRIASANPATQNQRLELTNNGITLHDSSNIQRIKIDTSGVIIGQPTSGHAQITSSGMEIFSDEDTSIANFGSETRIGDANAERFIVNKNSLKAYDEDGDLYFSVTANGISFGTSTSATKSELNASTSALTDLEDYVRGHEYVLTEDTVAQEDVDYYTVTYTQVTDLAAGDPVTGFYILSGGNYIPTTDTVAQAGTTYYSVSYESFTVTVGTTSVTGKYISVPLSGNIVDQIDDMRSDFVEWTAEQDLKNREVSGKLAEIALTSSTISSKVTNLETGLGTYFTQDGDSFTFVYKTVIDKSKEALEELSQYIDFNGSTMTLGSSDHPVCAQLSETGLSFYPVKEGEIDTNNPIASLVVEGTGASAQGVLIIHRAVIVNELRLGNWAWMPRPNNNLTLKWIGA